MKKPTRIILLAAALCLAFLAGCASSPSSAAEEPQVTFTPTPTATPQPTPAPTAEPEPAGTELPYVYHASVPVLMYHEVNAPEENDLYLSPENFASQLDWLAAAGYTPITMAELAAHWLDGQPIPERPIVLSFDDGYISMYDNVYPMLAERGWHATFYMIADAAHDTAQFLSPEKLKVMADAGMEIGSHTVYHEDLTLHGADRVWSELADSKAMLEEYTGHPVVSFCYPSGMYNAAIMQQVADAGYRTAVTTQYGPALRDEGLYELSRLRVSWGMGGEQLGRMLAAAGF